MAVVVVLRGLLQAVVMAFATAADGTRLWFEDQGLGPAVVFVHEFGGEPASWDAQVDGLSAGHRCIRYAARGFHPSDVPEDPGGYGQSKSTGDLFAILDHLGLDRAHLVGTSMGSFTSLDFALTHPLRVRSLTLVGNSSGPRTAEERQLYRNGWVSEEVRVRSELGGDGAVRILEDDPAYRRFRTEHPERWAGYAERLRSQSVPGAIHVLEQLHWQRRSLWLDEDRLRELGCPVLLAHGDEDYFLVEATNRFLEKTLPRAQRVVFTSTGHVVNIERAEEFNELLAGHIATADSA